MVDGLTTTIIVVALVVAAFAGFMALRDRPPRLTQMIGLVTVEALVVLQTAIATGRLFTSDRPDQLATFVGYLLTVVLIPPLAALLAWSENSRWGSMIIGVACLVVPVMMLRLQQVWNG